MFSEKWKAEIITVPNLLSVLRIAMIPVYISVYLHAGTDREYHLAGSILALSCMTDMADGIIARKFHSSTHIGQILDPLADKLTQLALIMSLALKHRALYPVLALFLIKETFQCGALLFFAKKGKALPGALPAGKCCTTVLFVSLIILVLFPRISKQTVFLLTWMDSAFLLYSFLSYFAAYFGKRNILTDWNENA